MNENMNMHVGPEVSAIFNPALDVQELLEAASLQGDDNTEETYENSYADTPVDYQEYIKDAAFVGEYPYQVILEGIRNQFSNYISTEDRTDYVDIFYVQWYESMDMVNLEEHEDDVKEVLDSLLNHFQSTIQELLSTKLALALMDLEGAEVDNDSIESSIRNLYSFFVLNARDNFRNVVASVIINGLNPNVDDKEYYKNIRSLLGNFSPLVTAVGPMEFLRCCKADEIIDLMDEGRVVGNFLRRYSPRFHSNEDFECEVIAHITEIQELRNEIKGGLENGTATEQRAEDVN